MVRDLRKRRVGVLAGAAAAAALAFPAIASATVTSTLQNGVLTVTSNAGDAITITCVANQIQVNNQNPGECDDVTAINVTGGPGDNAITLTGVTAAVFPNLTSVTVNGGGGNDTLLGSDRADVMDGGPGHDTIVGDNNPLGTDDDSRGGEGNDTMVWNPGDGSDINEGGAGTDTVDVNGGGGDENFSVNPGTVAGRVFFERDAASAGGQFDLDIGTSEQLDLDANNGVDKFVAGNVDALGFKLDVNGGAGNDDLDGGDGPDVLDGDADNDRIAGDNNAVGTFDVSRGGDGNDTLVWNPGDGSDINSGGAGTDTIEVNGGTGNENFSVNPGATAGTVRFERDAVSAGGFFSLDIDTSEQLDLDANLGDDTFTAGNGLAALGFTLDVNGEGGNDNLDGGDGPDVIDGGADNDRIAGDDNPDGTHDVSRGGAGDDTMTWNPGDDSDVNEGGEGNDTSVVNGATGDEKFKVKPSATPGRVQFDRVDPAPFGVDIGTTENLLVNGGDGNDKIRGSKGLAGLISSTFNGDDGNDRIKGTDGEDRLGGGKGHDLIRARDHAADSVECDGGIDLALVDRRDTVRGCELVLGGALKVALAGKPSLSGDEVDLPLRCVATARCKGVVKLRHHGKTLGKKRFKLVRGNTKTIHVELNQRGLRYVAGVSGDVRMKLRIVSHDKHGNGWRTVKKLKLSH